MKTTLLLAALALLAGPLSATTYYVNSATGSDGNPGTIAAPFQSFYKLSQLAIQPGDTIRFAAGTSYSGYFEFTGSGTAGHPITLTSYGPGPAPVFTNPGQWYAIRLMGDHLVLRGVKLTTTYESGAVILGSHCAILDCEMTDTGFGITLAAHDATIRHNYIHDLHIIVNTPGGDDDYGAVGINITNTDGADIAGNTLARCIDDSYDYVVDGGAFEFYGNVANVQVHHNWCEDNNGVFEVGAGVCSNVRIYDNVLDHNGELGGFHLQGTFAGSVSGFRFENNTVVDHATHAFPYVIWFDGAATADQVTIANNIFHYEGFAQFTNLTTLQHHHNLFHAPDAAPLGFAADASERTGDPRFVSLLTHDYRLQRLSPAVNAGTPLGHPRDFLEHPIVQAPDLGAYESPWRTRAHGGASGATSPGSSSH